MEFEVWGQTDIGNRRDTNQDSILVDRELGLFIVADGMGGHRGGEVASAIAVETAHEIAQQYITGGSTIGPRDLLKKIYMEASARIYFKSHRENPELRGMGTTMISALINNSKIYFGNVGDSRAYLYREGNLWQLTEDHSLINEQIKAGVYKADGSSGIHVGRNVITRSVGYEEDVECDILERDIFSGELFILCSDGLSSQLTNERIAQVADSTSPKDLVSALIRESNAAGGDDNVSVIVVLIK